MSKILIFSDLHIHMHKNCYNRLMDCIRCLQWILETAVKLGIKVLVFTGDLYQDRQKIHVISYQLTFQLLQKYCDEYGLKLYLLLGNHDMWYAEKWEVSSIKPLGAISGIKIVDTPCNLEVTPGFHADFLPFTKNPVEDIELSFKTKSRVLFSHIALDGALHDNKSRSEVSVENDGEMVRVNNDQFNGWEKVFLGHYHCAQQIGNIEYVGSALQLNFGEAFQQKHIIVFDTETFEQEYIENTISPKHFILHQDKITDEILSGNFVQVLVDDIASTDIVELRNSLKEKKTASLEFKEVKRERLENISENAKQKFDFAGGEVMERYMQAMGFDGLDPEELLNIGKEIVLANI